jgi:N-acetylmuramoyl-L-alanine amidase
MKYSLRKTVLLLLAFVACCLSVQPVSAAEKHRFTLVIDAGHGGKDPGALTKQSKEKTINLNVALAFGRYVEQNCKDVRVIYTRKTDVFIPLHERAGIANRNKADVFISIHTNSVKNKSISGLETYTMGMRRSDEKLSAAMRENEVVTYEDNFKQHYSGFDPRQPESYIIFDMINDANMLESIELAKGIQKHACKTAKRINKGVRQDAFLVLRETSMPACLIELGYITNANDEAYLTSKSGVDALARGIYMAFVEYKAKRTGTVVPPPPPSKAEADKKTDAEEKPATEQKADSTVKTGKTAEPVDSGKTGKTPKKEKETNNAVKPVFKVQFMASDKKLPTTDKRLKGVKNVDCYKDGAMWKYTVGASTDYDEINTLRKEVAKQFPQAFIVAFKNGKRVDAKEAIKEWKESKK